MSYVHTLVRVCEEKKKKSTISTYKAQDPDTWFNASGGGGGGGGGIEFA